MAATPTLANRSFLGSRNGLRNHAREWIFIWWHRLFDVGLLGLWGARRWDLDRDRRQGRHRRRAEKQIELRHISAGSNKCSGRDARTRAPTGSVTMTSREEPSETKGGAENAVHPGHATRTEALLEAWGQPRRDDAVVSQVSDPRGQQPLGDRGERAPWARDCLMHN